MTTSCTDCKATIVQRCHLALDGRPIFAETYECGAIRVWGWVHESKSVLRECPIKPAVEAKTVGATPGQRGV